jgi:ferric-dicitrate binding protein FerR (iron transport regulator)
LSFGAQVHRKVTVINLEVDPEELRQIYEQAALWMLRKEEGALTKVERRQYEAWLKLPHRAEALQQMERFSKRLAQPWRRRRIAMRLASCEEPAVTVPT